MKSFIIELLLDMVKVLAVIAIIAFTYLFFLNRDIEKVSNFCGEITLGLDVNEINIIAKMYDVGSKSLKNPMSIKNGKLGIKKTGDDNGNEYFFIVASPMTMGDYACIVYHDNETVLSKSLSW
jgi:hypothetical protein